MPKAPKVEAPIQLVWRTPDPRRYYKFKNTCIRNCIVRSATVLGACTIREKKVKGNTTPIKKLEFDCTTPGMEPYFAVECSDQLNRCFCIIIQGNLDRYLLALHRGSGTYTIADNKVLYENFPVDTAEDISIWDLEFVEKAVSDWLGNQPIVDRD